MDTTAKPEAAVPRRKRRWPRVIAAFLLVLVALVAALPFVLSTDRGRNWLLTRANATLNPGRLEVARFSFSWFRPTRMSGFTIRDPQGDAVVASPVAVWDRNLFQILFGRPRLGTLRLEGAAVDIERRADGSIDLVDALRAIFTGTPGTDFKIVVDDGSIRFRSPELADAIRAERFDFVLRRPASPGELTWAASFAQGGTGLNVSGSYSRWDGHASGQSDLRLDLSPNAWPLAMMVRGRRVDAILSGDVHVERNDLRWSTHGEAKGVFPGLVAEVEPATSRDLAVDGRWSLAQTERGWDVRDLSAKLPFATLSASGPISSKDGSSGRIEGTVDLPGLLKTFPETLRLRDGVALDRGDIAFRVESSDEPGGRAWTVTAGLDHIEGRVGDTPMKLREPATLAVRVKGSDGTLAVESARIDSAFLKAEGRGDLERGIAIGGTIDMAALSRQVGEFVDLGGWAVAGRGEIRAEIKGAGDVIAANVAASLPEASVGPEGDALALTGLKVAGSIRGTRSEAIGDWPWDASVSVDSAARAGLRLDSAILSVHETDSGSIAIDPILATLNGGKLRVVAEYERGPTPTLRLKPGTELIDAEVNEESSRRVLSFIAPVLGGATRATGRVSARIDRAEFPLGEGATRKAQVEGKVVFQDLEFAPGPVAADLLGLIGRSESVLRLDQPVVLSIADGRVRQTGLSVPVGKLARIELDGDVGFDRSLDLRATVPFNAGLFPNNPILSDVAAGTRITVPITGSLNHPKVDKDAFKAELANTGKEAAIRAGAGLLFKALTRPRDPNAPLPLTPAERKAKRQERKMQKRGAM